MDYYKLMEDVYRIQAGVGPDGEIYGGIFLDDTPGILIGASGGMKFVQIFSSLIQELKFSENIRIYFPSVTFNEIHTATLLKKKFDNILIYVHVDLVDQFKEPETKFVEDRYEVSDATKKYLEKQLPSEIPDVLGFDKAASFETEHTKILLIPFPGPHRGHTFIYSRDHKLLCSGLILGRTSDPRSYYIDYSGSFFQYENGLSFLEKARSEVIFPTYDEPEFTSNLKFKAESTRDAIKTDRSNILEICTSKYQPLQDIYKQYMQQYGDKYRTTPYDRINLNLMRVKMHLKYLVEDEKIIQQEDQYRLSR